MDSTSSYFTPNRSPVSGEGGVGAGLGNHRYPGTTWYEPLENQADIDLAVGWVLGRPGVFLNTVGDVDLLPLVLDAAERFAKRPGDGEVAAMLERSRTEPLFV